MKKIVIATATLLILIFVGYFLKNQNINSSIKNCAETYNLKDVSVSIKTEKDEFGYKYYVCNISCSNFEDIPYSQMYQLDKAIDGVIDTLFNKQVLVYYYSNKNEYYVQTGTKANIRKNEEVIDGFSGNYSSSSSSQSSSSTCNYKYSDGSICGASTNKYINLCDRHFEELYSTYQSLGGTKVPK